MNDVNNNWIPPSDEDGNETALERVATSVQRFLCGLRGHRVMTKFEPDRLALECHECGWQSTGFDVTPAPPKCVSANVLGEDTGLEITPVEARRRLVETR